ncbi:MAG: ArsA family ATPase [Actinomycetota bacterium]|nr:ArsA family ATPase [Actinomycetota bacterium]
MILFGGKGGAGKTTAAAATAIYLAQLKPERRLLVVSTDPAHSLGDSFGFPIGNTITPIKDLDNLWALEINAQQLYDDFRKRYEGVIKKIIDRGTMLDQEDISELYSLSLPGLDEVMAVLRIADILKSEEYDLIILDTAPTGHTIRLLTLPEQMRKFFNLFDLMLEKHRYLSRHFTGRYKKDETDEFVETMTKDMAKVKSLLSSSATEFVPVTIPEPMSIDETKRLLVVLKEYGIPVRSIIVNKVATEKGCPFCLSRSTDQRMHIAQIEEEFASYNLIKVSLFPGEVKGVGDLTQFAEILFGRASQYRLAPVEAAPEVSPITTAKMSDLPQKNLQFLLFGGKGGVGKTSLASATALHIARNNPDKRVLLFSTDPAHSLSDSFGFPIGDKITPIKGIDNLCAFEIDAPQLYEDLKSQYRAEVEKIIDGFLGRGLDVKFDREVIVNLIEISPPGLDEVMALEKIIELADENKYDLYILDTAPTGHLLRFLELPGLVREWLKTIFRILLKYRRVMRAAGLAEKLLKMARSVRKIREAFIDSEKCEFVAVTIPEAMGVLEMEDLLLTLRKLEIPCHHVVINMVIPPTECNFCVSKRKEQQGYIGQVSTEFSECTLTQIPLFPHEIAGIDALTELAEVMYGRQVAVSGKIG